MNINWSHGKLYLQWSKDFTLLYIAVENGLERDMLIDWLLVFFEDIIIILLQISI